MGFADCFEVAVTTSGNIPGSEVVYGLYIPTTDPESWHPDWKKLGYKKRGSGFVHFWVEKQGRIIDNATDQFGEKEQETNTSDLRYVRVGHWDREQNKKIPEVEEPIIPEMIEKGTIVMVIWNKYYEHLEKMGL